jgi:ApbE superfamily uncharacterized protein (UPF0280 family)
MLEKPRHLSGISSELGAIYSVGHAGAVTCIAQQPSVCLMSNQATL